MKTLRGVRKASSLTRSGSLALRAGSAAIAKLLPAAVQTFSGRLVLGCETLTIMMWLSKVCSDQMHQGGFMPGRQL
jgi:hypothetical protein